MEAITHSESQTNEIRKVFSICDMDGNGVIDTGELRTVVTTMLDGATIPDEEFQQILFTVNKRGDGQITWEEFQGAIRQWLDDDGDCFPETTKKRRLTEEQAREEIHGKIKAFFRQFRKSDNIMDLKSKLEEIGNDPLQRMVAGGGSAHLTSSEKLNFFMEYKKQIQLLPKAIETIFQPSPLEIYAACKHVADLLAIVEIFTPMERRAIADDIVVLFEKITTSPLNVVSRLVSLTRYMDTPEIQVICLKILRLYCPGPRIASTGTDSLLHPNKQFFKKLVIEEGIIPIIILLLEKPFQHQSILEETLALVGTLCSHHANIRDIFLNSNILVPIIRMLHDPTSLPLSLLKVTSYCCSVLCGATHEKAMPRWQSIQQVFDPLVKLLFANDEDVIRNVLLALRLILPASGPSKFHVIPRFLDLLSVPIHGVVKVTLSAVFSMIQIDSEYTNAFLHAGLLKKLKALMNSDAPDLRINACEMIAFLASTRGLIQPIIDEHIAADILNHISMESEVNTIWIKAIKYISRGTIHQVHYLVSHNCIHILCKTLTNFKTYDSILTEIYKFVGVTFNFELVLNVLTCLSNIVNSGELEAEDGLGVNQFALKFHLDEIDKLKQILECIKTSRPEEVNAWRVQGDENVQMPELRLYSLFSKIKRAHEKVGDKASYAVAVAIQNIWANYYIMPGQQVQEQNTNLASSTANIPAEQYQPPEVQQAYQATTNNTNDANVAKPAIEKTDSGITKSSITDVNQTVLFKCHCGDDTRIIELSGKPSYETLKKMIASRFNKPVRITFIDEEKDVVILDSDGSLSVAIALFKSQPYIKLQLNEQIEVDQAPEPVIKEASPHASPVKEAPLKRSRDGTVIPGNGGLRAQISENSFQVNEITRVQMKEMLASLEKTTHFSASQLQEIVDFVKKECKDGIVHREAFVKAMNDIGITDPFTIEQYYNAFDVDKDNQIDIKEFAHGLSVVLKGSPMERLRLLFSAYDLDGNGELDKEELANMFRISLRTAGQEVEESVVKRWIQEILAKRGANNKSPSISFQDFSNAIQSKSLSFHDYILRSG